MATEIKAAGQEYELVAASQTDQILGTTGAAGDILSHLIIVPETTGAGTVAIKDGNGSAINVLVAGTLADLTPIHVPLGAACTATTTPGWKITTGANVHVLAFGTFS